MNNDSSRVFSIFINNVFLPHSPISTLSFFYFDKAIQLDPNLAEAWNNRAAIYQFIEKNYDIARQYYNTAISLSKQANNRRVLNIARKNLSSLPPTEEILVPVTDTLTIEEYLNRFITAVDVNNEKQLRELVFGQKENSEKAMEWLIDQAMLANTQGTAEDEKAAVLLGKLLARLYQDGHKSDLLNLKLQKYQELSEENKK